MIIVVPFKQVGKSEVMDMRDNNPNFNSCLIINSTFFEIFVSFYRSDIQEGRLYSFKERVYALLLSMLCSYSG